jgi:hypothetical protein
MLNPRAWIISSFLKKVNSAEVWQRVFICHSGYFEYLGFQVEVTRQSVGTGIRFPLFLTRAVFDSYVTVPPSVTAQDEAGQLWDISLDAPLCHPQVAARTVTLAVRALRSQR